MQKWLMVSLLVTSTNAFAQLHERLDSLMRTTIQMGKPGVALLVEMNGKTVYQAGFGLADVKTRRRITPTTNFRLASVSKQFTAMGILLLEKDHKLSLADPLIRFFPELNARVGQQVQIRNLLTHSSGLLDYESVMPSHQREQLSDADVLALLKDRDSLYFEPGSQFRYSNSGYCLLALVIERVTGQSFATFLRDRLFIPLQMEQSTVYEANKAIANRAMGYRQQGISFVFSDQSVTSATKGDGGVYTSLLDYKKWIHALHQNTLLDTKDALTRADQLIRSKPASYYGAGWFFQQPANPIMFHSGSTCGFNNFVIVIPDQQFLVACFSNRADNKANVTGILKLLAEAGYQQAAAILTLDELTN